MEIRQELIKTILSHFVADFNESASPITDNQELINYVEKIREFILGIYETRPASDIGHAIYFNQDEFIRQHLLAPFREKMKAFNTTELRYYFCKESRHKEQLFKKLNISEALLNDAEYEALTNWQLTLLNKELNKLYLLPLPKKDEAKENEKEQKKNFKSTSTEYTRNRQVLMLYYMLHFMGIKKGGTAYTSTLARFAHALFGYPFDTDKTDNSPLYNRLKLAPDGGKGKKISLLKDLEFVKQQFKNIEYQQAVDLIQKKIVELKAQKPPDKRANK